MPAALSALRCPLHVSLLASSLRLRPLRLPWPPTPGHVRFARVNRPVVLLALVVVAVGCGNDDASSDFVESGQALELMEQQGTRDCLNVLIEPGADLSDCDLEGAQLSGVDLSGANMINTNMSEQDLSGTNLSGANLTNAELYGANLYGANLSSADLTIAFLSNANLSSADLSDAELRGAYMSEADLTGANFDRAHFEVTTCPDGTTTDTGC